MRRLVAAALAIGVAGAAHAAPVATLQVKPSALDPAIKAFDEPHVVLIPAVSTATTPLALFLPGTKGRPANAVDLLAVIAAQGYRVIGLEYDDEPAVSQVCPNNPDPACSGDFRQMRIWGDGPFRAVSNPVAESIDVRLTRLLQALDKQRPAEGWAGYIKDGHPDWSRIVVSGLSQGAGMAAYIAKKYQVARVVLFSSPWDWVGRERAPAPWLSGASATPMQRWYAEYNTRENTARELQRAYAVLKIPPDQIRAFNRDIPAQFSRAASQSPNPYHGMTIRDVGYADDWRAMFGRPGD